MRLSRSQAKNIVSYLPPNLELYHGKFIHNKVPSCEYYRLIPKGKKFLIWFKKYDTQVSCYFIELSNLNLKRVQFKTISILNTSFDDMLTMGRYGTICYGTLMHVKQCNYFSIEDILYYKNKSTTSMNWKQKYHYMNELMRSCKPLYFTKNDITFGVPIVSASKKEVEEHLIRLPYKGYCIEGFSLRYRNVYKHSLPAEQENINGVFTMKAEVKSDTYSVYCENIKIGNAYIPSYNLSVYLNRRFRNIKENENLDMLEESDSEDEFENMHIDKYVDMEKEIPFMCVYNKKFKAWIPEKDLTSASSISYTDYKAIKYL